MYLPTNCKSVIEIGLFIFNSLTNIIYYLKNKVHTKNCQLYSDFSVYDLMKMSCM